MRNCTKSVSSSLFSDRPPSRGWLSKDTCLTLMWTLWKLMSARSLWSFEGLSLSTAPLAWKIAWNSVLVIGSLPLVPPVLYLMWYLRVISYPSVESLYHALQEIIVQPSSIQALLRRIFPSYWLRPFIDLRHLIPCLYKYSFNWYEDLQSFREELLVFHLGYHHVDILAGIRSS